MTYGLSSQTAVMLDYDDLPKATVLKDAMRLMGRYMLQGFLLVQSSPQHWHVVFNRELAGYPAVCVVVWSSKAYCQKDRVLRERHNCLTLRLGRKEFMKAGKKVSLSAPRIISRHGQTSGFCAIYEAQLNAAKG